ncbi:hypothetical protein F4X10_11380 [Candidatus Poribacteria bacterium]|nr:hypothetical protein [Candidatus Poribacteria bacterium]
MVAVQSISTENQKTHELFAALKLLSPGTYLREGIDYIIQSKTGGLVVLGDTPEILKLTEGGFRINCPYTPTGLYELSKMDGAIILSEDVKRIVRANVTLRTSSTIPSNETGLRHRSADKFARQTEHIVLAVSRSRNTLTLYLKDQRYIFQEPPKSTWSYSSPNVPLDQGVSQSSLETPPYKPGTALSKMMATAEAQYILAALEENKWNIQRTAEALEVERSNLYRKMNRYGISRPSSMR